MLPERTLRILVCVPAVLMLTCCGGDEPGPCEGPLSTSADVALTAIEAGGAHTCALLSPCGAVCWGDNLLLQVGIEGAVAVGTPVRVARTLALHEIDLGQEHTCGLAHDGTPWCWGSNRYAQLTGERSLSPSSEPNEMEELPAAVQTLSAGGFSTCAVLADGSVVCWGNWHFNVNSPTSATGVVGVSGAIGVDREAASACALVGDGGVACWGHNEYGQLGDGTMVPRENAQAVVGMPDRAVALGVGGDFSCAVLASGQAACWGRGDQGELGNGVSGVLDNRATPGVVLDVAGAIDISASISHACALLSDGGIACWGANTFAPDPAPYIATPVRVEGVTNAVDVAVGAWYTCALTSDQEIYCWGENDSHQLGLGDASPSFVPTPTRVDWRAALP